MVHKFKKSKSSIIKGKRAHGKYLKKKGIKKVITGGATLNPIVGTANSIKTIVDGCSDIKKSRKYKNYGRRRISVRKRINNMLFNDLIKIPNFQKKRISIKNPIKHLKLPKFRYKGKWF